MNKQAVYRLLEEKMLRRADYVGVPVTSSDEKLVKIDDSGIVTRQIDAAMVPITGDNIYVRESVAERLEQAAGMLAARQQGLNLEVVYGYRPLSIQTRLFEQQRAKFASKYRGDALTEFVHKRIASPDVAGHPTGGAVDIQIIRDGEALEFGTKIWEFAPGSYTFSPFVGREAWRNRQLLREVMMLAGFAPFDGEWWHFSYGDKEWAKYYNQPAALYEQVEFSTNTGDTV